MSSIELTAEERLELLKLHKAEKQLDFLENELRPVLDQASDESPVYFEDAVHPTHNVQAQYGWILKGTDKEVRTNSGRQRVNINGALCFHALDIIYREDKTIDRFSSLNLLKQIRNAHDASVPIAVVLDNAKLIYPPSFSLKYKMIEKL